MEDELIEALGGFASWQLPKEQYPEPFFCFLSDEKKAKEEAANELTGTADPEGDTEKERRTVGETREREKGPAEISPVIELSKQVRTSKK